MYSLNLKIKTRIKFREILLNNIYGLPIYICELRDLNDFIEKSCICFQFVVVLVVNIDILRKIDQAKFCRRTL